MRWLIESFPKCAHHAFLSHSAEDRDSLAVPIYRKLVERGIVPWVDKHDYPYGREARVSLRDSLLRCRHVIFFITEAMLTQARGWCVQELVLSELLQDNLVEPGGKWVNVLLPLYFVERNDIRLPRTVWETVRQRGIFCPAGEKPVTWSVNQIHSFLTNEKALAKDHFHFGKKSPQFRKRLRMTNGLFERVTKFEPSWFFETSS